MTEETRNDLQEAADAAELASEMEAEAGLMDMADAADMLEAAAEAEAEVTRSYPLAATAMEPIRNKPRYAQPKAMMLVTIFLSITFWPTRKGRTLCG